MTYCMDQCIKSMRHGTEFAPSIVARQWKDPMIVCHVREKGVRMSPVQHETKSDAQHLG